MVARWLPTGEFVYVQGSRECIWGIPTRDAIVHVMVTQILVMCHLCRPLIGTRSSICADGSHRAGAEVPLGVSADGVTLGWLMPIDYHSLHTGEVESMTYGLTDTIDRALKEHQAWY